MKRGISLGLITEAYQSKAKNISLGAKGNQGTKSRISPGLMTNAGVRLASSRWLIFGAPLITLGLIVTNLSIHCQVRANKTYSEAERQFSDQNRDVLMNIQYHISGGPLVSL